MLKKFAIAAGVVTLLVGIVVAGYVIAKRGVVSSLNKKMNIFNMVDGSLSTMCELNDCMAQVKTNVDALNGKLDLLGRTNELLGEQLSTVERLNGLMSAQEPLLNTTNESVSKLAGRLGETLEGVGALAPVMSDLVGGMQGCLDLTSQVVGGTEQMVAIAGNISGLFDQTIACLARIQPLSAKAKAYMNGDLLSRLDQFIPKNAPALAEIIPGTNVVRPTGPSPADPVQKPEPVINIVTPVVETTTEVVEEVKEKVIDPITQPVTDLLK